MLSVLKSLGFLLIFLGLVWFGHFGLIDPAETPWFAAETVAMPLEVTPPAPSLVWASLGIIVGGGAMVVIGFLLIGRIKNLQLRAEARLNKRFYQQ